MMIGSLLALGSVLLGAISQIFLKKAADKKYDSFFGKFLNIKVLSAYIMMLISSFCSALALRFLELNLMPVFQATSFFWIMLLSALILKEKIERKKLIGICIIFVGIIVYIV